MPEVRITGVNYLGFVVMSGYEVDAYVDGGSKEACELEGCATAHLYRFRVRVENYLVLGLGFSSDVADGTFSWTSTPIHEDIECVTPCICCDAPQTPGSLAAEHAIQKRNAALAGLSSAVATVGAVAGVAALATLARGWSVATFLNFTLSGIGALALVSLVVLGMRQLHRINAATDRAHGEIDA
jgi:hypothetical protein